MRQFSSDKAIRKVAKKYMVTEEHVISEIEKAIEEAMKSPDPMVQKEWEKTPWKGRRPSAAEFIEYISNLLSHHG